MFNIAKKIFGTKNARVMKAMQPVVQRIGSLEEGLKKKSDSELAAMTLEFRRRHDKGETLDDLLPVVLLYALVLAIVYAGVAVGQLLTPDWRLRPPV